MVIYNYIFDSVRKVGIFSVYPVLPRLVSGEIFILKEKKPVLLQVLWFKAEKALGDCWLEDIWLFQNLGMFLG